MYSVLRNIADIFTIFPANWYFLLNGAKFLALKPRKYIFNMVIEDAAKNIFHIFLIHEEEKMKMVPIFTTIDLFIVKIYTAFDCYIFS